jgi:hypothetical protein
MLVLPLVVLLFQTHHDQMLPFLVAFGSGVLFVSLGTATLFSFSPRFPCTTDTHAFLH